MEASPKTVLARGRCLTPQPVATRVLNTGKPFSYNNFTTIGKRHGH
jgi:hypothetical protein